MHTFLAVEPCDYEIRGLYRFATLKDTGLAEALADVWPDQPRLLMVAADPADATTTTENLALDLASALTKAGRGVGEVRVLEQDTAEHAAPLLAGAQVVVLADGDDEKRAAFYADINLVDCLAAADENVVLIGLDGAALEAAGVAVPVDRAFN